MTELVSTRAVRLPPFGGIDLPAPRRPPVSSTSFVGRVAELDEVGRLVCGNRLVTLVGAGGVGKTRLAMQLVDGFAVAFDADLRWVDLAPIAAAELVAVAVARALGVRDQPGRSTLDSLTRFIAEHSMLIVLDNCEHLPEACASVAITLLESCPGLRILVTSRQPLGVRGEVIWRTPSLSLDNDAVELFVQRARLVRPDFALTPVTAATVDEICARLDGVPLAIELAAARVRSLSLTDIVDGLQDRFRLLTGRVPATLPRQQTLRASVDWSHALLSEPERVLFRRLAVFMGGFDLVAAHAVAGDEKTPDFEILDGLSLLVDKSLVIADDTGQAMRYRLLETVRQYARDQLAECGEVDTVRDRHRDHYTALAVLCDSTDRGDRRQRIEWALLEIHNLRAAFARSRQTADIGLALQLASSLQPLWLHGQVMEGMSWFDAVLTDDPAVAPAARARAHADRVMLYAFTGAFDQIDQVEPALAIARDLDDPALLARVLTACGATCAFRTEAAAGFLTEAIGLARTLGDQWRLSQVLAWQALSAHVAGDPAAACAAGEEGRAVADSIGDGFISRMCRWCVGLAQWIVGDLDDAIARFRDVEAEARAANDPLWRAYGLFGIGKTLVHQGDPVGARAVGLVAAEVAADVTGVQQAMGLGVLVDAALASGDGEAALPLSEQAWQTCSQRDLLGSNVYGMAQAALAAGDLAAARRWADDAVEAASGGHRMILLAARARIAIATGDGAQANRDIGAALAISAQIGGYLTIPDVLECSATLSVDAGRHAEAARLFGAAQAIRERTGQVRFGSYEADYVAAVSALRAMMGDSAFDHGWEEGAALTPGEAVGYAQRGRGDRRRPSSGWESLTPTEHDVIRLVVDGLTNKDIATRLFISPRTVQTHLSHVYTKLGLASRVQLAQEATRHT
ncbi:hypothetical protein BHQ15_03030 [Mycolicibacillus koreensis]|nr:hypothetical protein BHQ15_03030 [Mycolicibacillus koreensis]